MKKTLIVLFVLSTFKANSQNFIQERTQSYELSRHSIGGSFGINENFSDVPCNELFNSLGKNLSIGAIYKYKIWEKNLNSDWSHNLHFRFNINCTSNTNKNASVTEELRALKINRVKSNSLLFAPYLEYNLETRGIKSAKNKYPLFSPYIYGGFPVVRTYPKLYSNSYTELLPSVKNGLLLYLHGGVGLKILQNEKFDLNLEYGFKQSLFVKNISGVVYSNNIANRKDFFYNVSLTLIYRIPKKIIVLHIDTDGDGIADRDDKCPTVKGCDDGCKECD